MKKTLTIFALAVSCGFASAQTESAFVSADNYDTDGTKVEAGAEFCKSASVTMKAAFAQTYKPVDFIGEADSYNAFVIDDESVKLAAQGVRGQSDPSGFTTKKKATSGSVFQFDVKESGVLYVSCTVNADKPYYVWNNEGLVAYSVSVFDLDGVNYAFTMPKSDDPGFSNYTDTNKYLDAGDCSEEATGKQWDGDAKGVVAFPVTSDNSYYVYAGSATAKGKPNFVAEGFIFVKGADAVAKVATATVQDPDPEPEPEPGTPTTAVKGVSAGGPESNAPIYNLLGQRVQDGYKGICIQNGRKFIVR